MIFSFMYVQYKEVGKDLKRLNRYFYVPFILTFIIFVLFGVNLILSGDYFIQGCIWILTILYAVLSLFVYNYKLAIDIVFALIFIIGGIAQFFIGEEEEKSLVGITIMFGGLFILTLGSFISQYLKNKAKKQRSILMHTPRVLPMLEFKIDTKEMVDNNKEPVLFILFVFMLIIWSFIATGLIE